MIQGGACAKWNRLKNSGVAISTQLVTIPIIHTAAGIQEVSRVIPHQRKQRLFGFLIV
jgi:hypothetical protein